MQTIKEHMQRFVLKDIAASQADHYRRFKLKKSTEKLDYLFFFHRISACMIIPYHMARFITGSTFPDLFLIIALLLICAPTGIIEGLRFSTAYSSLTKYLLFVWTACTAVGHTVGAGGADLQIDPILLPMFAQTFSILNFTPSWYDSALSFSACLTALCSSFLLYFGPTEMVLRTCFVIAMLAFCHAVFTVEDERNMRDDFLQEHGVHNLKDSFKGTANASANRP